MLSRCAPRCMGASAAAAVEETNHIDDRGGVKKNKNTSTVAHCLKSLNK